MLSAVATTCAIACLEVGDERGPVDGQQSGARLGWMPKGAEVDVHVVVWCFELL